jgi:alkaline phosphatase D
MHPTVIAAAALLAACAAPSAPAQDASRWLGPEWHANRLQDWRAEWLPSGVQRLVCDDSRLAVRTAHRLVERLEPAADAAGVAIIEVSVEPVGAVDGIADAFAGVLLGAGNEGIDHRLTSLVQQVPAPDGGLLAVLDGTGTPRLLDFSTGGTRGFSWTLPNDTTLASLVPVAGSTVNIDGRATAYDPRRPARLSIAISPARGGAGFDIGLRATQDDGNGLKELGFAFARALPREAVDGALALVSHGARRRSGEGWAFEGFRTLVRNASRATWFADHPGRAWGPVLGVQYTLDRADDGAHALRMLVHLPVDAGIDRVALDVRARGADDWSPAGEAAVEPASATAVLDLAGADAVLGGDYRIRATFRGRERRFDGTLRAAPATGGATTIAALNCVKHIVAMNAWNRGGVWFPHEDLVGRVAAADPDIVFFAGDQLYEGDIGGVDQKALLLDYHTKFGRWLWAFGELCRDRPSVVIPDDHDVFHGNLWGAGGVSAKARDGMSAQDAGGYKLPVAIVNAVHRSQTGNLPPRAPEVDAPVGDGVEPYSCRLRFGSADLLVLSDRMWKDSASVLVPEGKCVNGFFTAEGFDPLASDRAEARLLGEAQEALLARWADARDPRSPRKVVLSQSPFAAVHTLPKGKTDAVVPSLPVYEAGGHAPDDEPVADTDTNGWPQSARARAVTLLARADALHLAGDQHLGSLVQYGVDGWRDGGFAFTPPAIANTWPRRWMPAQPGRNPRPDAPRTTGDFTDAFGNRVTVWAVTNPEKRGLQPERLHDLSPGFGLVRIAADGSVLLEARPRGGEAANYPGWPFTISAPRANPD